jgi:capsid assembly protease
MGHDYSHILNAIFSTPWAIRPEKLQAILEVVMLRAEGYAFTKEEIRERLEIDAVAHAPRSARSSGGGVAVLPIVGTLAPRMSAFEERSSGGVSVERLTQSFRQSMNDPQVDAIVLDIHSPGGSVFGVQEFGDEVFQARRTKPVIAVANHEAASALYWIGSAASEFIATPSSMVGSIGVVAVHDDMSQALEMRGIKPTYITSAPYKAEGNPDEPLTDEGRAAMQKLVDDYDVKFVRTVARNRGVTMATVRKDFGQGRIMTAEDALRAGMVDRIGTLDMAIMRAATGKVSVSAESPPTPIDVHEDWVALRRERLEVLGY